MWNQLLSGLLVLSLVGCSEPSDTPEPEVIAKKTAESGVYPPALVTNAENTLILWVAAEKRECMAVGPTQCLQIRHHPKEDWQLFYGDIVGFDYQPGQLYQIEVSEVLIPEPPADAPDRQWVLNKFSVVMPNKAPQRAANLCFLLITVQINSKLRHAGISILRNDE